MGRVPREPWRVASRCEFGYPNAIVSPSRLADGTPFPTYAWLTCPWLSARVAEIESSGATDQWARDAAKDEELAKGLRATDESVRAMRSSESGGLDECDTVGIAGQKDPLGVKCLHAHTALAIIGVADPIGRAVLADFGVVCPDERCAALGILTDLGDGDE